MIQKIGIIGGGQLARMLSFDAKKMGMKVIVLDPTPESPAGQVSDQQIIAGYKDEKGTRLLSGLSDVVTIDAEFVNTDVLITLEKAGTVVCPSPKTIALIKDKFEQKKFLSKNKIPTADFKDVAGAQDILSVAKEFGYPFLLKAKTDAFDGRGNMVIRSKKDIAKGLSKLKGRALYVEKFVPFEKELSVVVAVGTKQEMKIYPVVETRHMRNICDTVISPAHISKTASRNAIALAYKTMKNLQGPGVFAIEMFLKKDDNVLVNEVAPRVHNSGHLTIEACITSQFEQHIRAITGMPLGDTSLKVPAAVMKNILGKKSGEVSLSGLTRALKIPGVTVHIYGKKENRLDRKMGHITVVGKTTDECLRKANKARSLISI